MSMFVLDCGRNSSILYDAANDSIIKMSHAEVLKLHEKLPRGSKLRCEYAHLGCPRKKRSKAQPFTAQELLTLYDNLTTAGIELLLTPHQATPRAQNYSRLPKSDENDARSIYKLLKDFPQMDRCLMKPPKSFDQCPIRAESYELLAETNDILNEIRRHDYDDDNIFCQFLKEHIEEIFSDPLIEDAFSKTGSARFKKNNKVNYNQLKTAQIYSLLALLLDDSGNPRIREKTGNLVNWKFAKKYLIRCTPFHFRGGVCRSNLYYHGLRHWVSRKAAEELGVSKKSFLSKRRGGYTNEDGDYVEPFTKEEDKLFVKYREEYCKRIRLLFRKLRDIVYREKIDNGIQGFISITA